MPIHYWTCSTPWICYTDAEPSSSLEDTISHIQNQHDNHLEPMLIRWPNSCDSYEWAAPLRYVGDYIFVLRCRDQNDLRWICYTDAEPSSSLEETISHI